MNNPLFSKLTPSDKNQLYLKILGVTLNTKFYKNVYYLSIDNLFKNEYKIRKRNYPDYWKDV